MRNIYIIYIYNIYFIDTHTCARASSRVPWLGPAVACLLVHHHAESMLRRALHDSADATPYLSSFVGAVTNSVSH